MPSHVPNSVCTFKFWSSFLHHATTYIEHAASALLNVPWPTRISTFGTRKRPTACSSGWYTLQTGSSNGHPRSKTRRDVLPGVWISQAVLSAFQYPVSCGAVKFPLTFLPICYKTLGSQLFWIFLHLCYILYFDREVLTCVVQVNTTSHITVSALVYLSKLVPKHINPIPSTIYKLF